MKFIKVNNFWWELEGKKIYNMAGGHQLAEWHDTSNVVEVEDWDDLNWEDTDIYDNKLKAGWIDREGKFYGCGYHWHSKQAEFIHKKTQRELELLGWVKVYRSDVFKSKNKNGYDFIIIKIRLNELQKNMLSKLGFTDEEIKFNGSIYL